MKDVLDGLYGVVLDRKSNPQEGSYTNYLFGKGLDKILKKVGEECAETLIAAKNGDNPATVSELCDLLYHLLVLMAAQDIPLSDVAAELETRRQKLGNLKPMRETDRNT
ncbi:MAG: phosphoribosyl-ATP diphosphatase [Oscillospiraceae bacterium]|nr:phosphoribosyl-ATP diphosphatase [Oscillospiraceae bacterium]